MRTIRLITAAAMAVAMIITAACSRPAGITEGSTVYDPVYAHGFEITAAPDSSGTIITTFTPWQGADSTAAAGSTQLFVARDGRRAPEGFAGQTLSAPARRIVAMSSTHIAMLDAFGEGNRVAGVSGIGFITSPSVTSRRDSVADVGYDGNIDYELIVSLEPDLVLLYGVNGASVMEPKLTELGIPFMYVADYLEQSPLGKAEWMVAIAEACGVRQKGEQAFAPIPRRYNELRERVAAEAKERPAVMLNAPYGDSWLLPPADSYTVRLINDAGGRFVHKSDTSGSSEPVSMEQAWVLTDSADVWLNPGQARSLAELAEMCPRFTDTRCFKAGRVFNNNARSTAGGGNEYFETAVVHPDVVLADMISILHPELADSITPVYYQQLR